MESSSDQFTSVYRHDFIPIDRGFQLPAKPDYDRTYTIREDAPFVSTTGTSSMSSSESVDLANEYLENTFKHEQPKLYKKYFKNVSSLNKDIIEAELVQDTVYVNDYCRHMKGPVEDKFDIELESPEAIESTMRDHYRQPSKLGKLSHHLVRAPQSTLTRNQNVVTSVSKLANTSEYQRLIGSTGKFIMDNEMYGKMIYPS